MWPLLLHPAENYALLLRLKTFTVEKPAALQEASRR
jgi:hypothetical protein